MKDKYYIPSVEEFRIGFEYESSGEATLINNGKGNTWYPMTITDTHELSGVGINEQLRVKYLDKKDIESLGWEPVKLSEELPGVIVDTFKISPNVKTYILTIDHRKDYKIIQIKTKNPHISFFIGDIKNKSELKILMKQLGIG